MQNNVYKHVVLLCSLQYHIILIYKVSVSQLAPLASYVHKYSPIIMYCVNKNHNVYKNFNMTLHAGLANPTCLQSVMVFYCSVYESRESNSKKEKKKLKNFGAYGRIGIFLSRAQINIIFWSSLHTKYSCTL